MTPAKLLTVFALSLILSGCSLFTGGQPDPVTIKYWGTWDSATVMNQIRQDYKLIKPHVDIEYQKQPQQQYRETIEARSQTGDGPDVFQFHNTWTPMLVRELAPIPESVISQSEFQENYFTTVFTDLRNSAKEFVGAPMGVDGLGLYWNEDLFQAAGVLTPPATWQELAQTAARLTVKDRAGNIRTAGIALGTSSNVDHFSDILGLMVLQNGGDLRRPTDQQSADALDYYVHFAKGEDRVWDEAMPPSTIAFYSGSLAMYLGPSWRAAEIKRENPQLKFKVAPVPQLTDGSVAWASYWAVGVSSKIKDKDKQKEAFEFLKYLQKDETLIKLYSESAKTPGRLIGMPYPKKELAKKLASDPISGAYVTFAPFMHSFPMASNTFDNGLNDQIIAAYKEAVDEAFKRTSSEKALETVAQKVAEIFRNIGSL